MIKPHKYLDINSSLLSIGAIILRTLMQEKIMRVSEIELIVKERKGEKAIYQVLPTLHLLYILNKIEYYKEIDSIEYKDEAQ